MPAGGPNHGISTHRTLRIGKDALPAGEKARPMYLGGFAELSTPGHLRKAEPTPARSRLLPHGPSVLVADNRSV